MRRVRKDCGSITIAHSRYGLQPEKALFDPQLLAGREHSARLQAVELLQRAGADAVGLGHGSRGFALAAEVVAGIAVPGLLLALDEDHFAVGRTGAAALHVVELAQVARRKPELAADVLVGVVLLGQHVVHAVGRIDVVTLVRIDRHPVVVGVDQIAADGQAALRGTPRTLLQGLALAGGIEPLAVGGRIEQMEVVVLDDADQTLRIVGRRGVAGRLQTARPALVVGRRIGEKRVVAGLRVEKYGMVMIRRLDRFVGAETLVLLVVVVIDPGAGPVLLALNAEVVVRLERKTAVAAVRLEDALRHGDAGRNAVTLHLGHGDGLVALDVLLARDARLRSGRTDTRQGDRARKYCFS